jgi:C-terminal processing protease CtpA/Prc
MINLEKIGRVPDKPLVMVGCATSSDWLRIVAEADAKSARHVECVIPELVPDTDHYPFGALGIPAAVFGTVHEEDSHQPTDESSRLDFDALAGRAAFVRDIVTLVADRDGCLEFEAGCGRGLGLLAVAASAAERTELAIHADSALKVSVVLPGLPAARAGLEVGDFVTEIDGKALPTRLNERELHDALVKTKSVEFTVHRAGVVSRVRVEL